MKWGQKHRDDFEQHTAEQHRLRIAALEGDEKRNQAIAERWAAATNLLTLRKARHLAELAWRSFGVPPKWAGVKIKWHVEAKQTIWEEAFVTVFLPADAVTTRATKHGPKDTIRGLPERCRQGIECRRAAVGWLVARHLCTEASQKACVALLRISLGGRAWQRGFHVRGGGFWHNRHDRVLRGFQAGRRGAHAYKLLPTARLAGQYGLRPPQVPPYLAPTKPCHSLWLAPILVAETNKRRSRMLITT